jgi:8-oxo-dGTP pyrophosphatase MutT (NUDIX family)
MKAAGIIFTNGKQILLLKKPNTGKYPGIWCIPGGKAENNETPLENALREAKEECGYNQGEKFGEFHIDNFTTFLFAINQIFQPKISQEHTQFKWFNINKLPQKLHPKFLENWHKYNKAILEKFSKNKISFKEWIIDTVRA